MKVNVTKRHTDSRGHLLGLGVQDLPGHVAHSVIESGRGLEVKETEAPKELTKEPVKEPVKIPVEKVPEPTV